MGPWPLVLLFCQGVQVVVLWMRNHPKIMFTAPEDIGTAHTARLVALGFSAAGFAAAATCRGDVDHG